LPLLLSVCATMICACASMPPAALKRRDEIWGEMGYSRRIDTTVVEFTGYLGRGSRRRAPASISFPWRLA
jgi:hypothetical protein